MRYTGVLTGNHTYTHPTQSQAAAHDLSLRTARSRLASFLLEQLAPDGEQPATRWTHEQIAACIGSMREVVSRTLRSFAREGLIAIQRQHITILDHDGLRQEPDE